MTETDHTSEDSTDDQPTLSRRDALAAIAGIAVGGAGAAAVAQDSDAAGQGSVGTSAYPLAAAYLAELRGPIVDQGDVITQLVDTRVAEDGASISPDPNTLVFRYDANATV
jgi:hypothetical protein